MVSNPRTIIVQCVRAMIRPLALFCVRRGLKFREFTELAKSVFIEAAEEEISRNGYQLSTSKISVMTGVQRFEVKRVHAETAGHEDKNLVVRVVGLWSNSTRFCDTRGKARKLSYRGMRSEFARLVRSVSKDLNPHTVLFELERLGILEKEGDKVALKSHAFIAQGDPEAGMRMVGADASDLITAGAENSFNADIIPHLHARTEYDNIPDEALPQIRRWFLELGGRVHTECRNFLSRFDRDLTPQPGSGTGRNRIILGTFSYIDPVAEDVEKKGSKKG